MNGCGDVGIDQAKAVAPRRAQRLRGEASVVENAIQQVAGAVTGENTTRAIGSVGGGRESQYQQLRIGVAERRDGLTPVVPITIGAPFDLRDLRAVGVESGTAPARDDFLLQEL